MGFELNNEQRRYFGLEPIESNWAKVTLKGDAYRPESTLYFDGDVIKRYIISTGEKYHEMQYDDLTRDRAYLLPVTIKGPEKKLSASVLESRQARGVYCCFDTRHRILIANYDTQTAFYDSWNNNRDLNDPITIGQLVSNFINEAPYNYLTEIDVFKKAKRKNVKFKQGDIFTFKIALNEYAFGRILLNIDEVKKKNLVSKEHGFSFIMGKPVLIKIYAYTSPNKKIDIDHLIGQPALPSDYIMDNKLFYGEFEIIGNKPLTTNDMDFPMSYGRHIDFRRNSVFFQWGMINMELPFSSFNKYLLADNPFVPESSPSRKVNNPYGYYGIGFFSKYTGKEIRDTISNQGVFDHHNAPDFKGHFDLRNPQNLSIKNEIMKAFGLDPAKNYDENCVIGKAINTAKLLGY